MKAYSLVVIGKKIGEYKYDSRVSCIEVPEDFTGRMSFIIGMLLRTGFKHLGKIVRASTSVKGLFHDLLFYLPIIAAKPDKVHLQWTAFVHNRDFLFDLFPDKVLVSLRGAHINYTPVTTPEVKESYLRLLPRVSKFHAVSKAIVAEAKQYGVYADKTKVIYSCISDELLKKELIAKDNKELDIISVGRFFWKKGYCYALDAAYRLKQQGIAFSYTIIAEGEVSADIKYQIHQLGLAENVTIKNGCKHTDALNAIENADVLLLPSVEEGVANVVLEAMALGTLVITTNVGGMEEVVRDRENGFVVPVRDVEAMSSALQTVSNMPVDERQAMARQARQTVEQQHNKETYTKQFVDFYKN